MAKGQPTWLAAIAGRPNVNHEISLDPSIFFGQIFSVLFGILLLLLGVAIFYTIADWWLRGQRIAAFIIGVRRRGPQFFTVFRYSLHNGEVREATSIQGGSSLKGRDSGRRLTIRVMPNQPDAARETPGTVMWALASGLFLGGAWLTYDAVTTWKHSLVTWLLLAIVAMLVGRKIQQRLLRFWPKTQAHIENPWNSIPIEPAERFSGATQFRPLQVSGSAPRSSSVIFCIAGVVVLALALFLIRRQVQVEQGIITEGTIARLHSNMDNKNNGIYPDVTFTDARGATVRFSDRVGSNPSPYRVGDHVPVLYQPAKPETAVIDRGWRNWEPIVGLLLMGTVMTGLGFLTLRAHVSSSEQSKSV